MTGVFPWPLETVSQDIEGAFRVSEKTAGGKRLSDGELRSVWGFLFYFVVGILPSILCRISFGGLTRVEAERPVRR